MQTEWIIAILSAACVVFFLLSKKNQPGKMRTVYNREDGAARDFRLELETVAELAVRKIEEKISRLDYLIEKAQEKSNQLDAKIKLVNNLIDVIDQIKEGKDNFPLPNQKQKTQLKKEVWTLPPKGSPSQLGDIGFTETVRQKSSLPIFSGGNPNAAEKELLNNEKHRVALTMLQEGYNVLDIAKVTGLGKGEIMLLQGLHDRKK